MRGPRVLEGAQVRSANEAHLVNGEWVRPPHITLRPEALEKIRQGYFCHRCLSDTTSAFECPNTSFCKGFTAESLQEWLGFEYRGEEELWPDRSDVIRDERERDEWAFRNGVFVPRGAPDAA